MYRNKKLSLFNFAILLVLIEIISTSVVTGVSPSNTCCDNDIIEVTSVGSVSVQPDIAIMTIGITVTDKTSQAAVQQAASKVSQITTILKSNNVSSNDIQTTYVSLYTQFNYTNGAPQAVGQSAQQTMTVTIRKITKTGGSLGTLIDKLSVVNGFQLQSITFDKENKTSDLKSARTAAFNNAKNQAADLASLSGRKLGNVIKINDSPSSSNPSPFYSNAKSSYVNQASVPTQISVGNINIDYSLYVKFQLI